jgi:hypothetical protein
LMLFTSKWPHLGFLTFPKVFNIPTPITYNITDIDETICGY